MKPVGFPMREAACSFLNCSVTMNQGFLLLLLIVIVIVIVICCRDSDQD